VINKPMRNKTRNYTKVTQRQLGLENCMAWINYSHDIYVT
jgi:hypothetical protein